MDKMQFYREKLLDHYHHPRNVGTLERPDFSSEEFNHACGDQVRIDGSLVENKLHDVRFVGSGCVVSQAASSLLLEHCKGKTIEDVMALDKDFMMNLVGIPLGPTRLRCALLPLYALQHGIESYLQEQEDAPEL